MKHALVVLLGLWLSVSQAVTAHAVVPRERLEVQVVEVAGGRAYLAPGPGRGVRLDTHVNVGKQRYRVVSSTRKFIVIELGQRTLARGQRAVAWVTPEEMKTFATRPQPKSLHAFEGKWQAPARPAEAQAPRFVPLGVPSDTRRSRAALMLDHSRTLPLTGPASAIARTRVRAMLHAELTRALTLDADAVVEVWEADDLELRRGDASRPLLNVRQLELGYRGETLQAAIGRLRYAATTVGMLDGARASANLGEHWGIAAFGGTLPDPLDGRPETDTSRFGAELLWQGEVSRAPARASLTAQGSRFLGQLDERRLTAIGEVYPKFGRIGARAEVAMYDRENPWNADPAELTALGGDATFRTGDLRFGLQLETRRPERSYYLAAALPAGYFCVAQSVPGAAPIEPCVGGDMRSMALLTAAWDSEHWTIDGGGSAVTTAVAAAEQASAFVNLRRRDLLDVLRFDAGASVSSGSLLESAALSFGVGAAFWEDRLDASVYYRPSVLRYRANSEQLFEHGTGARLWWALFDDFDTSVSADLLTGPDVDVLFLQGALAWRPRF